MRLRLITYVIFCIKHLRQVFSCDCNVVYLDRRRLETCYLIRCSLVSLSLLIPFLLGIIIMVGIVFMSYVLTQGICGSKPMTSDLHRGSFFFMACIHRPNVPRQILSILWGDWTLLYCTELVSVTPDYYLMLMMKSSIRPRDSTPTNIWEL